MIGYGFGRKPYWTVVVDDKSRHIYASFNHDSRHRRHAMEMVICLKVITHASGAGSRADAMLPSAGRITTMVRVRVRAR